LRSNASSRLSRKSRSARSSLSLSSMAVTLAAPIARSPQKLHENASPGICRIYLEAVHAAIGLAAVASAAGTRGQCLQRDMSCQLRSSAKPKFL
jgi:hypothetical protein